MSNTRRLGATLAAAATLLQACYTSLPLQQEAPPLSEPRVELVLNDLGRSALGGRLGSAVDRIEGHLMSVSGGTYEISVFRVKQLAGGSATWNGEVVTVMRDQISGFQVRRIDRQKSVVFAIIIAASIVAVYLGISLAGSGSDTAIDAGGGGQTSIIVR